uniref:UDP-glucuronosyltransferase n=1 Tax=Gorilla gorilla gorilla TaxID=9595 RepID=G3S6S5_GORGO
MSLKWTSVFLLIQLSCYFSSGSCGKVLVWPTEYSHWINMKTILEELVQRGHEVTVLTSSASTLVNASKSSAIKLEVYPTSLTKNDLEDSLLKILDRWIYGISKNTFWSYFSQLQELCWEYYDYSNKLCKDAVLNKKLMMKVQESKFDVILADALNPCGELLAELFNIPFLYSLRFSVGYTFEKNGGGFLFPPSYVPVVMSELSDQMIFTERIKNMIHMLYFDFWFQVYDLKKWDQFYSEVLVLWRFDGKKPNTLGSNTQLYKWLPQNDLLGHPKTKAFITHGGTNGIYEAIYHGIPMVGIPLFADQHDNIAHMKAKGAALSVDIRTMSSRDLLNALKSVINDPIYKENVMKLSRIHHDQPMKPLDRAVFWIEFVMRHKGAKHLRVAAHNLTWIQYHSLDVIAFLLACVTTVIFIITKCCLFCFRKLAKTGKKKKRD